jgi:hypothetical protein
VPILNDAHLLGGALLTHHCPWGIAVIAGTGSVVVALDVREDGDVTQMGRRGGLGYLLGDDGSGERAWILVLNSIPILILILIRTSPCLGQKHLGWEETSARVMSIRECPS